MEEKFGQFEEKEIIEEHEESMINEKEKVQEEPEEQEKIEKLEKLHKKALAKRAQGIHRSTKTLFKIFEPLHFKLRDHVKWYYRWHTSILSTVIHWSLFFGALFTLIFLGYSLAQANRDLDKIPEKNLSISGVEAGSDTKALDGEKNNIKINKTQVKLDDREITIGILKKKADLGEWVSWKNVSFSADTPAGTSIVYRVRTSNIDKEDSWKNAVWSKYYQVSGNETKTYGTPQFKSQYMEIEIFLEGNKKDTPTLNYLKFGYTPFRENKIIAFFRDKIVSGIVKIFKFFEKRERIE